MDNTRSTGPVSATVFKIVPMDMEVGLGSEDTLGFEYAGKDSSERKICQATSVSFY